MSTHENIGSNYEHHQRAAELHDIAAHAHQSAAEAHGRQDHRTGQELSRRAHEHTQTAYEHTVTAHRDAVAEHGSAAFFGHQDIAVLAHRIWQARGCPEGSPEADWHQAVCELRARRKPLRID